MSQAITTKFIGPTNHRDPRIVASCERGRIYCNLSDIDQHDACREDTHREAAFALLHKFANEDAASYNVPSDDVHWLRNSKLYTGGTRDSYVHVIG